MAVDALSVATVGFQSSLVPISFALCIATEGYVCLPQQPQGPVGGAPVFFPSDPCVDLDPAELATLVWDAVEQWNAEAEDTSRDLAALTALKAYPGGDTLGTQFAAVVALVVEDEGEDDDDDDELD